LIVVDASLLLAWSHRDEWTPTIEGIVDRIIATSAVVPGIWPLEIANGLEMAVRRGRTSVPERDELIASYRRLPIEVEAIERDRVWAQILNLAHLHRLTVYDASYLELAMRRGLPLATLDKELIAAARAEGVEVLPSAA
jgi:predicted nucleic acid-binding protein